MLEVPAALARPLNLQDGTTVAVKPLPEVISALHRQKLQHMHVNAWMLVIGHDPRTELLRCSSSSMNDCKPSYRTQASISRDWLQVPEAQLVSVEPASEDDWELVEIHAEHMEEQLLNQVCLLLCFSHTSTNFHIP